MVKMERFKGSEVIIFEILHKATVDDVIVAMEDMYKNELNKSKNLLLLLDIRDYCADYSVFAEFELFNNITMRYSNHFEKIKTAILISKPIQAASAMYYADKTIGINVQREVFSSVEASLAWLKC